MMSLFSSFDSYYFSFSIISSVLFLIFLFPSSKLSFQSYLVSSFSWLLGFFYSLKPSMVNKFSIFLLFTTFITIFFLNFLSVFPFVFPATSSFGSIMFFSLSMWGVFVLFSIVGNFKGFISHFVPEGSPLGLSVALFLIEMVSTVIRPITLTVRLVANILAGHLLMILLSQLVLSVPLSFVIYVFLNLVELFVALIQSYIFCTMLCLYYSEVH